MAFLLLWTSREKRLCLTYLCIPMPSTSPKAYNQYLLHSLRIWSLESKPRWDPEGESGVLNKRRGRLQFRSASQGDANPGMTQLSDTPISTSIFVILLNPLSFTVFIVLLLVAKISFRALSGPLQRKSANLHSTLECKIRKWFERGS